MPAKPRVLNDDEMAQVEALASALSTEQIADYLGIARRTLYDIMERQPKVSARYKKGRAKAVGSIAKSLLQKAQSGDNTAMIFYLKTQAGWKETIINENTNVELTHEQWLDSLK
tara:strand:+ start:230 stop:571 length:342 start_codon:yes stop_codon:yes gene_type:complete